MKRYDLLWRFGAVLLLFLFTGCDNKNGASVVTAPTVIPLCTEANGTEPWVSDGTEEGTIMLKDIIPGPTDSVSRKMGGNDHNKKFVAMGSIVLFPAKVHHEATADTDEYTSISLWKSDGTPEGTLMLHDFNYSLSGYTEMDGVTQLIVMSGELYFRGWDPEYGFQIWKSDGSAAGTKRVTSFDADEYNLSTIGGLRNLDSYITFHIQNLATGEWEIRKSDGTAGNGSLIRSSARVGNGPWDYWYGFKVVNGKLYFRGYDQAYGYEPWVSDGTAEGTHMIKDINPGAGYSDPSSYIQMGDHIYFSADINDTHRCLFRSDGTEAGTTELICAEGAGWEGSQFRPMKLFKGKLYFVIDDGNGRALWTTDGTETGTRKVFSDQYDDLNPKPVVPVGDHLFFKNIKGSILYSWDGTAAEPTPLPTDQNASAILNFKVVGEELWFIKEKTDYSSELWKSDGTVDGTEMIKGGFCYYNR